MSAVRIMYLPNELKDKVYVLMKVRMTSRPPLQEHPVALLRRVAMRMLRWPFRFMMGNDHDMPDNDMLQNVIGTRLIMPIQEHLALLRRMAAGMPTRFPDLAALADGNEDVCFFANVAHLQLHRRTRALGRLTKVRESRDVKYDGQLKET